MLKERFSCDVNFYLIDFSVVSWKYMS